MTGDIFLYDREGVMLHDESRSLRLQIPAHQGNEGTKKFYTYSFSKQPKTSSLRLRIFLVKRRCATVLKTRWMTMVMHTTMVLKGTGPVSPVSGLVSSPKET